MASDLVPSKQSADNALIALIATAAQDQSIDVSKLQQLVELRERILAHEAELAFNVAMNEAQGEMTPIVKDAKNPHAGNRYATLEQVDREIRPIYAKHGFCLTFNTATPANPNAVHVTCEVRHSAGHKKEYYLEGDLDVSGSQGKSNKTSIQGLGSSVSYLRRYLTLMIFNLTLTNEDNDGNGNRPGWGDSGSKAASDAVRDRQLEEIKARRAAREAVESPSYRGSLPPDPPDWDVVQAHDPGLGPPHDQQLRDSIAAIPAKKLVPKKRTAKQIEVLEWFGPLHDKYTKLGMESRYYEMLGGWGVTKSTEFNANDDKGYAQALKCRNEMQIDVADQETRKKQQEEHA